MAEVLLMQDTFRMELKVLVGIHLPLQLRRHILDLETSGDLA